MKYSIIVLLTFLSVALRAQEKKEVSPVISDDYLERVRDTTVRGQGGRRPVYNNISESHLRVYGFIDTSRRIGRIFQDGSTLHIFPVEKRWLSIGGSYNAGIAVRNVNRQPALQNRYAQGRSINGALSYQGPETNELFSYGPDISTIDARAHDNSIFRTGTLYSQSIHVNAEHTNEYGRLVNADLKLGQMRENTVIKDNENRNYNLSANVSRYFEWFSVTGKYNYQEDRFSNANRNGFLNRVYQNALLTPVTFDNSQVNAPGSGQSSYSNKADNPLFLLDNNNFYKRLQHNAGLTLDASHGDIVIKAIQSFESATENSSEGYKPGTVSFPEGVAMLRSKHDRTWVTRLNLSHPLWGDLYDWAGSLLANYIFTDERSAIAYAAADVKYVYQRSSQDVLLSHKVRHSNSTGNLEAELETGNRFYFSNTASKSQYLLPAVSGNLRFLHVLRKGDINVNAAYNRFNSELPVSNSLARLSLLRYTTAQASQFLAFPEVSGFDGLDPIQHREWTASFSWRYAFAIFTAIGFVRESRKDIFAVYDNGRLDMHNMADHRNKGVELQLNLLNFFRRKFTWTQNFSFLTYQDKVTQVSDGYNFTPIAGFSNVHKAIVQDRSVGAIVGSAYRRDASGNIVIGSDGFPLADNEKKVIGDAIPDWVMKWSQRFNWKKFTLNIDLEWKKGGDIWNGTQAVLDYYGRSAGSGALRNTKDYVFNGVLESGRPNNIPVDFYDPAAPFAANRWVRYDETGVAEEYIQKADHLRLNTVQLTYEWNFKKYIRKLTLSGYVNNLMLWTPYKGADPNQLLYDQPNTTGLDFFNLPSVKTIGCNVSIQF